MKQRPDPQVEAHTARQAAEHQRATLPGLSDERLAIIAKRLSQEKGAAAKARLTVVRQEIRNRRIGAT